MVAVHICQIIMSDLIESLTEEQQKQLNCLLPSFDHLFAEPTVLPPLRDYDHQITLKTDTKPVHAKPYRYHHIQKEEIERQIDNMLQ